MSRVKRPLIVPRPETVQVGGKIISVKLVKGLQTTQGLCGAFCMATLTIEIDADLLPVLKTETYFHEVVEAYNKVWFSDTMTHEDINRMGEAMYQTWFDMGIEIDWA